MPLPSPRDAVLQGPRIAATVAGSGVTPHLSLMQVIPEGPALPDQASFVRLLAGCVECSHPISGEPCGRMIR